MKLRRQEFLIRDIGDFSLISNSHILNHRNIAASFVENRSNNDKKFILL